MEIMEIKGTKETIETMGTMDSFQVGMSAEALRLEEDLLAGRFHEAYARLGRMMEPLSSYEVFRCCVATMREGAPLAIFETLLAEMQPLPPNSQWQINTQDIRRNCLDCLVSVAADRALPEHLKRLLNMGALGGGWKGLMAYCFDTDVGSDESNGADRSDEPDGLEVELQELQEYIEENTRGDDLERSLLLFDERIPRKHPLTLALQRYSVDCVSQLTKTAFREGWDEEEQARCRELLQAQGYGNPAAKECATLLRGFVYQKWDGKGEFPCQTAWLSEMVPYRGCDMLILRHKCRKYPEGIIEAEAEDFLSQILELSTTHMPLTTLVEVLDQLLSIHPELSGNSLFQSTLAACAIAAADETLPACVSRIDPWLQQIPNREIVLVSHPDLPWFPGNGLRTHPRPDPLRSEEKSLFQGFQEQDGLLAHWDERLSDFTPVLLRENALPIPEMCRPLRVPVTRALLDHCTVKGEPPAGALSKLAADFLQTSPAEEPEIDGMAAELFAPGGLLYGEDVSCMLDYLPASARRTRAAILAYTAHDDRSVYEL